MRIVKSKTLHAVEPHTEYRGCTFYLEGPHCLDDCVFDNCSFRGELHYVESEDETENGIYHTYPSFNNCSLNLANVQCDTREHNIFNYKNSEPFILFNMASKIKVKPLYEQEDLLRIEMELPKIKTIDLSAYESYSEIPVDWFDRFPTLERVILPRMSLHVDDMNYLASIGIKTKHLHDPDDTDIMKRIIGIELTRIKQID